MKKSNIILLKITSLFLLAISTSCSKESCTYVIECGQKEPEGYMVATNASFITTSVGVVYKTTFNSNAPVGGDWNDPSLATSQVTSIYPTDWNNTTIGQVFGIALDLTGGIYLSATDIYNYDGIGTSGFGTAGRSGIYKTNINTSGLTTTPLVTTFIGNSWNYILTNKIPNSGIGSGNSIGNIAYDKAHNQLFVSNLEDGRIYRIDATSGNVKSVFDPFALDTPSNGMVAVGERIWGIGVLTQSGSTEVYFARSEATFNSIWSIKLDASGEFIATPQTGQPNVYNDTASSAKVAVAKVGIQNKISDIEFSCSGKMLIAERGAAHNSSIYEYKKTGSTWSLSNPFYVGGFSGQNAAGGVDYGARESGGSFVTDDIVWASGNYMPTFLNSYLVYGIQGMNSLGNSGSITPNKSTDLYIDRNAGGPNNKGGMGDVDVFDSSCPCNN